jgi:hypothetical protein
MNPEEQEHALRKYSSFLIQGKWVHFLQLNNFPLPLLQNKKKKYIL